MPLHIPVKTAVASFNYECSIFFIRSVRPFLEMYCLCELCLHSLGVYSGAYSGAYSG
jgi:hypothetical protein